MPEGHTLHRLAAGLRERFGGRPVRASSPQGRFADGAALVDGRHLVDTDAHGKHLFLGFGDAAQAPDRARTPAHWVHVHLGLYGTFVHADGPPPAPVGRIRLRLAAEAPRAYADLRGPAACEVLTAAGKRAVGDRLGPDPLRADADPDRAWARISRSRTAVAALLMDQRVVAGVGNVYRAEVLFRHGVAPHRAGRDLDRTEWDAIWADLAVLMREGVRTGHIDTVRPEHAPEAMGRPPRVDGHGGEVYVYRRAGLPCHVCGGPVGTAPLAGRNLFWCPACQRV